MKRRHAAARCAVAILVAAGLAATAVTAAAANATVHDPVNFRATITTPLTFVGGSPSVGSFWQGDTLTVLPRFGDAAVATAMEISGRHFSPAPPFPVVFDETFAFEIRAANGDTATIEATTPERPDTEDARSGSGSWTLVAGSGRFSRMSGTGTFTFTFSFHENSDLDASVSLAGTLRPS